MALSAVKTFIAGEVLTASDLNALNTNILNNALSLVSPVTGAFDFDGNTITLDAAAATTVASTAAISWNFTSGAKTGTPGTGGSVERFSAQTFTDSNTAGSGTAAAAVFYSIAAPTLAATNASVTTTDASTWYIAGPPTAGTNETITNAWAIWVDAGNVRFDGNIALGGDGSILDSSSNEYIKFSKTGTAVNEVTITNAATGNGPIIAASGETNVPITLRGVGTGAVLLGQATATDVRLVADQPIADSSGNEFIKFSKTATAVNEITVTNAAANGNPILSATGGDADISLELRPKGTDRILLTDGTDVTKKVALNISGVTTGTTRTVTFPDTDLAITIAQAATQAEQETASSTTVSVTPGRQQFHPGHPKFWINWNTTGTTIAASYNVTSVTNTGTGDETITIATDFSSADWCALATARRSGAIGGASRGATIDLTTMAAGTLAIGISGIRDDIGGGTAAFDSTLCCVAGLGDQA